MKAVVLIAACLVLAYAQKVKKDDGRKALCENLYEECKEASKVDLKYNKDVCDDFKRYCMKFPCKRVVDFLVMGCEKDNKPDETTIKMCRKIMNEDYDILFCNEDSEMKFDEDMKKKKGKKHRGKGRLWFCQLKGVSSYFNCLRKRNGTKESCSIIANNTKEHCNDLRNVTKLGGENNGTKGKEGLWGGKKNDAQGIKGFWKGKKNGTQGIGGFWKGKKNGTQGIGGFWKSKRNGTSGIGGFWKGKRNGTQGIGGFWRGKRNGTRGLGGFGKWIESACARFNFTKSGCRKFIERNVTEQKDEFDEAMDYNGFNMSCTDQTLITYSSCMNVTKNVTVCKIIAKVYKEFLCDESVQCIGKVMNDFAMCYFYEKNGNYCVSVIRDTKDKYCSPQDSCAVKTYRAFARCVKKGGNEENCTELAKEFVKSNCLNSSLSCENQTGQYYNVCMLIHNNTKICGNEAEKFYKENCGGDDKASCAYKSSGAFYECLVNTNYDARVCGIAAGKYFNYVCHRNNRCVEDVKDSFMTCYHRSKRSSSKERCAHQMKRFLRESDAC